MRARRNPAGCSFAVAFAILLFHLPAAQAQQMPRSVTIGTNPPGTVFYALASGLAKVASDAGPIPTTVQPYTGTSTLLPLLNNGELDFALVNGVDMGMAYLGPQKIKVGGKNDFPHSSDIRLVMRGAPLMIGLLVKKDSPLKSIQDIKGKRVTGEYPAHQAVWFNVFGLLATAGLSWKDVNVVPVPAVNDGVDALVQGRADVSAHAVNSAKIREADAAVGIRHLPADCSPEGDKRVRQAVPGYYTRVIKAGGAAAMVVDTCVIAYDIYFSTHKAAPDHVVSALLKAVWDNQAKLIPIHPTFREWTQGRAATAEITIPYHPAAIKFYREKGVWKPEMDQAQARLSAQN